MSNTLTLIQSNASNPKVWVVIGVTVAGIVILAETRKRRIKALREEDFGAFLDRFELLPFPPPPPPAAKQSLSGLTFSISDAYVPFLSVSSLFCYLSFPFPVARFQRSNRMMLFCFSFFWMIYRMIFA